jgi:hypothetical protein
VELSNLTNSQLAELAREAGITDAELNAPVETPVDAKSGVGFGTRVGMAFKGNEQERLNYLAEQYGADKVRMGTRGRPEVFDGRKWIVADPKGLDIGDAADFIAGIPEGIGSAIGFAGGATAGSIVPGPGTVLGGIGGAAAGGAAGNAVKQAIGAMLPGANTMSVGDRATEGVQAGVLGGAFPALGVAAKGVKNAVMTGSSRVLDAAMPGTSLTKATRDAPNLNPQFVAEGQGLEGAVNRIAGGDDFAFTAGQRTGSQEVLKLEDFAKNSRAAGERFWQSYRTNVAAIDRGFENLANRAATNPESRLTIGTQMRELLEQSDEQLLGMRSAQAQHDYAIAAQLLGNQVAVRPRNLRQELAEIIRSNRTSEGTDMALAQSGVEEMSQIPRMMTVQDLNVFTQKYGTIGYGKGDQTLFANLGEADRTKMAKRLFRAINQDIDAALANPVTDPAARMGMDALRTAKNNFAQATRQAEQLRELSVSKLLGKTDGPALEKIPDRILSMSPAEIRETMAFVDTARPELAEQIRRLAIDRIRDAGIDGVRVRGTIPTSPAALLRAFPNDERLHALFGRGTEATDLMAMRDATQRISRMGGFTGESPTAPRERVTGGILAAPAAIRDSVHSNRIANQTLGRGQVSPGQLPPNTGPGATTGRAATYMLSDFLLGND